MVNVNDIRYSNKPRTYTTYDATISGVPVKVRVSSVRDVSKRKERKTK